MARSLRAWGLLAVLPAFAVLVFAFPSHVADAADAPAGTNAVAFGIDLALAVGIALGVVAAVRERADLAVGAAWVLLLPVFPLGLGFAWVPVLASVALLVVLARRSRGFRGATRWAARALAALVAAAGLWALAGAVASGVREFLLFSVTVLAVPALMLWAAWWPSSGGASSAQLES